MFDPKTSLLSDEDTEARWDLKTQGCQHTLGATCRAPVSGTAWETGCARKT